MLPGLICFSLYTSDFYAVSFFSGNSALILYIMTTQCIYKVYLICVFIFGYVTLTTNVHAFLRLTSLWSLWPREGGEGDSNIKRVGC